MFVIVIYSVYAYPAVAVRRQRFTPLFILATLTATIMSLPFFRSSIRVARNNWQFIALVLFCVSTSIFAAPSFAQTTFPNNTVWKTKDDARVFLLSNSHKRHLSSPNILYSYGFDFGDVKTTNDVTALMAVPNVRVAKTPNSPAVYDISSGYRVPIVSESAFLAAGYSWDEIAVMSELELDSYPAVPQAAPPIVEDTAPMPLTTPNQTTTPADAPLPPIIAKLADARKLLHTATPIYPQQKRIAWTRSLTKGMSGSDVVLLQEALKQLGYFPKTVLANGVFGPTTTASVVAFQKAEGIEAIGVVGPQTREALERHNVVGSNGKVVTSWQDTVPSDREVLLAVWNPSTNDMQTVQVTLTTEDVLIGGALRRIPKAISKTAGFRIDYTSGNGVNVQYTVASPSGYQVLANKFPIFDSGSGTTGTFPPAEEIYVPYSDTFLDPVIVASGRSYLDDVIVTALKELNLQGVHSVTGRGLVGDVVDPDVLRTISLIEHMDTGEFLRATDKGPVLNKVFAILATNREDSYRFAGSSAGALGLAQFIKPTYASIAAHYPSAHLIGDFKKGMADHVNAFKAMALYTDLNQNVLESYAKANLSRNPALFTDAMREVLAAAYNGGATRVRKAIQHFGDNWQVAVSSYYGLRNETKSYLKKFRAVESWLTVS
ncbi:hypothetical protein COV04_01115 [Candidatus Uhrbacteria bacterium CG10_big_fil_rev_8_21_14_0_10_48_11]|uniref:Peptidoglycan binding-like domain-containing protein n=1 Tax=Candidatus Uhrbacteria bacterium CG10_big_fil_rev_8_21_14_0_10_48_11 TaxID=1975037 RepID=A0A2M8LF91_9BACT|nr:MAG: hypothetical protein COV04_01115 [Candidatus Uhrbacteria bacterium CG10_big_fil_rev_8_21_14_0_10_48_11]